jgi:hypothetical protein
MLRGGALLALALVVTSASSCKPKPKPEDAPWKLPVEPKQLPQTASIIEAEVVEGMREPDPRLKEAFTSAELGSEVCREGAPNPAFTLELMPLFGPILAKGFFVPENLVKVQSLLECGGLLAGALEGGFQTAVGFVDDQGAKAEIDILKLNVPALPPKYGLSPHAFGAKEGYCKTSDPMKPNQVLDCGPSSEAALKDGNTWFLGKRIEIDAVARSLSNPKTELSTGLQALNDAANQVEGLSNLRIESQLTTSKPFMEAPCAWASLQTVGSGVEFLKSCFPFTDSKVIQDIDAKLRAAAFEIEPDVLKAGGVHGGIVLVARDDESAKAIEKDAQEFAIDWKAQLENNESKMITQAKKNPHSLRQRQFAIIVDNFTQALRGIKVTRSNRVVKLQFHQPLDPNDRADLDTARAQTNQMRGAVADILNAVKMKQMVPVGPLSLIVGGPWANYLAGLSVYDPKNIPPTCANAPKPVAAPVPKGGKPKKGKPPPPPPGPAAAFDPRCQPPVEPPGSQFGVKS